jgi:hypothetical protein
MTEQEQQAQLLDQMFEETGAKELQAALRAGAASLRAAAAALLAPSPAPLPTPEQEEPSLRELSSVINRHNLENGSDTPDFILAQHLLFCLQAFNATTQAREKWYGREKYQAGTLGGSASAPVSPAPDEEHDPWGFP